MTYTTYSAAESAWACMSNRANYRIATSYGYWGNVPATSYTIVPR